MTTRTTSAVREPRCLLRRGAGGGARGSAGAAKVPGSVVCRAAGAGVGVGAGMRAWTGACWGEDDEAGLSGTVFLMLTPGAGFAITAGDSRSDGGVGETGSSTGEFLTIARW